LYLAVPTIIYSYYDSLQLYTGDARIQRCLCIVKNLTKKLFMTIHNFTGYLSKHELKKGEDYYKGKKVTKLKENEDEEWTAVVNGREPYEVEISMDDDDIIDVSCECIAHTEDEYCKHVIAVLFAIQEKEGILKKATANELETIVNEMSPETLRMIVLEYAWKDQSFKNTLITMQEEKDNEDKNINRYSALMTQVSQIAEGAKAVKPIQLTHTCIELQKKAEKAFEEKKFVTSTEIALALVKTVPAIASQTKNIHPSIVQEVVAEAFELLINTVNNSQEIDDDAEALIWKHASQHVKDTSYPLSEYETHWIDLLAWTSLGDPAQEKQVLDLINELIAIASTQKNKKDIERLKELEEFITEVVDESEEDNDEDKDEDEEQEDGEAEILESLSNENPDLKNSIETAVKSKNYKAAKQLAEQAMQQAKEKNDLKSYEAIKFTLMSALQRSSDVLGLRELARRFYEENRDARYYAMWKDTYILTEWKKISDELIEKLERNIFAYAAGKGDPKELADVYVKEYGYDKSLLNLLKKAPRLPFLNDYVEGFDKSFATQLLQLYKDVLLKYANNSKAAKDHVDFLLGIEKMQDLKGGKAAVQELATEIKVQNPALYKLLPAGMRK
jgi:hypothetical protein